MLLRLVPKEEWPRKVKITFTPNEPNCKKPKIILFFAAKFHEEEFIRKVGYINVENVEVVDETWTLSRKLA